MKLYWVRHLPIYQSGCYIGQTDVEAIIPPHTAKLDAQIPEKALWFSSPLKRAESTARWLMQDEKPLHLLPELQEQHFGAWEGKSYESIWKESDQDHDWSQPESIKPPSGESFSDVCERINHWLNWLFEEHIEQPVVIVAHAGVIRAGLRHALKLMPFQALAMQIDYASVTHLTYFPDGACVHYVNLPILPAITSH